METLLAIIFIVFGLLQIILFFKIWGMTNDIREMKNKYFRADISFSIGDTVRHKTTGKEMRIRSIKPNGKYACFLPDGRFEDDFDGMDIELMTN